MKISKKRFYESGHYNNMSLIQVKKELTIENFCQNF